MHKFLEVKFALKKYDDQRMKEVFTYMRNLAN